MLYSARPFALLTIVSTCKHRTIGKFFIPAIWLCIPQWASSLQKSRSLSTSLIAGQRHLPWESESCRICPRILNPIDHRRAVLVDDQNDRPGRHEDGVHFSRLANVFSEINISPHHPVERPRRSWHEDGYPLNFKPSFHIDLHQPLSSIKGNGEHRALHHRTHEDGNWCDGT